MHCFFLLLNTRYGIACILYCLLQSRSVRFAANESTPFFKADLYLSDPLYSEERLLYVSNAVHAHHAFNTDLFHNFLLIL